MKALGATVVMTRHSNRQDRWGPCVDERGRLGNAFHADLKISVHGDGSYARGAHGFHVIAPVDRAPWTHDIYRTSRRLALATRAALLHRGLTRATYVAGGDGLDFRRDLATLNLSDVPTVMVSSATCAARRRRADDPAEGPRALRTLSRRRCQALPGAMNRLRPNRGQLTVNTCRNGYRSRERRAPARLSNWGSCALVDLVRLTRANAWLIFIVFSLGLLAAFAWTLTRPVLYSSTATGQVFVGSSANIGDLSQSMGLSQKKADVYSAYVSGSKVQDRVAKALDISPGQVNLSGDSESSRPR